MKPPANDAPLVLVKWYAYAKWILERVESFPKSQHFHPRPTAFQPRHGRAGDAGEGELRQEQDRAADPSERRHRDDPLGRPHGE